MTEPTTETISSDERPERVPRSRGVRAPGVGMQATALGAALSLVMVGGLVTAAYRNFHGATDPASLIPASAFAVGIADLSVPGDDLDEFADHFHGSPTKKGEGSAAERLLRAAWNSDQDSDYDTEVGPWLGDHVAVAGWLDDKGHPQLEVLLESNDDARASKEIQKSLDEEDDGGGFVIVDGYVVLSETEGLARTTVREARASSLASSSHYADDVDRLPDGAAAVGWADGPAVKKALGSAFGDEADTFLSQADVFGLQPGSFDARVAAGLQVAGDYAQVDVVQFGGPKQKTAASSRVTDLPNGTIAALELADPGPPLQAVARILGTFTDSFSAGMPDSYGSSTCTEVHAIPPDRAIPLGTPDRRRIIRELRRQRGELREQRQREGGASLCTDFIPPPAPVDPIDQIREATGLNFPDDFTTMLGSGTVVAYGGLQLGGPPDLAIRTTPDDLSAGQSLADTLSQNVLGKTGIDIAVKADGDDLVLASSSGYADQIAGNGGLGEQKLPSLALGDVPGQVSTMGYVDLSRLWPLAGDDVPDGVTHLKALGFWTSVDGSVQRMQLRLVVG